jgi:hypothetical protein
LPIITQSVISVRWGTFCVVPDIHSSGPRLGAVAVATIQA